MNKVKGFKDTIDWYDKNAETYSKAAEKLSTGHALEIFSNLFPKNSKILDAGCGSGRDSNALRNLGFDITGIDISKGLIKVAREKYPNIKFVIGDLLQLPFKNNSFDGIWAQASLVHFETIEETKKVIEGFYRIIKHNGLVHIYVKENLSNKKTDIVKDSISKHDRFFRYYTKDELSMLLINSGFEIFT